MKDRNGNIVPGSDKVAVKTEDGKSIYSPFCPELQTYLEAQEQLYSRKVKGKFVYSGGGAKTGGEILATTQRPTYNADTKEGLDIQEFENLEYDLPGPVRTRFDYEGHDSCSD